MNIFIASIAREMILRLRDNGANEWTSENESKFC